MECTHHWKILTPNGKTSLGRCKKCGERKKFKNALDVGYEFNSERISPKGEPHRSRRSNHVATSNE